MSDIFTLDENNNAAVRTVSVNAGATESNQPDIFTTDENGNAAVRVVGSGGGGQVTSVNGQTGAVVTIDDNSTTSTTESWSASKLNTMIGDIETLLSQI